MPQELGKLAFYNLQDFYGPDGKLLPVHELPRELAAALTAMEVGRENVTTGDTTQEWLHA